MENSLKMTVNSFDVVMYPSINTDWHIVNTNNQHKYSIQFPILSRPKLINHDGQCISRVYNDETNSFLRYIGLYDSNQIFTLTFNPQFEVFSLNSLSLGTCKFNFYWKLIKNEGCLELIDSNSRGVVAKVKRFLLGNKLASIEVYRDFDDQFLSVILFSGSVLLNQSKILKSSPSLKSEKVFAKASSP
jgi:hypothetical protein